MEEKLIQQKSNCLKIVLFGPESTGKTTLSKQLAAYYKTKWVPEFSRIYAEEKLLLNKLLTEKDVLPIAIGQMALENKISKEVSELLICDTNLLETKVYSEYIYHVCPEELTRAVKKHKYHLYVLTGIDIPWQEDPVRSLEDNRKEMFDLFKKALEDNNLPFIIVSGDKKTRFDTTVEQINSLLQKNSKKI